MSEIKVTEIINDQSIKEELKDIKKMIYGLKDELKGLIEIQQKLVHERLNAPIPAAPVTEKSSNKKQITISKDMNSIVLTGNTFDYNSIIKETAKENNTSARWESSKKAWILNEECLDDLIKKFENAGLDRDTDFIVK